MREAKGPLGIAPRVDRVVEVGQAPQNRRHVALLELVPSARKWQEAVKVIPADRIVQAGKSIMLTADAMEQEVNCFIADTVEATAPSRGV